MLQSDYNLYPYQCILYYCNSPTGQNDSTVYQTDLSNVCLLSYDGSNNIVISGWLIGGYGAPSTATILTYNISDVLTFYNNFYIIPAAIGANEPYMISTSDLANVRADNSMIGFVVYDTTAQVTKYWSGSSWDTTASRYLSSSGGTVSGTVSAVKFIPSTPNFYEGSTTSGGSTAFTASTPRLLTMSNFSSSASNNFSSSGQVITYNGTETVYFKVQYTITSTQQASAYTLNYFISQNGSTSLSSFRTQTTGALLGETTDRCVTISQIFNLATNDTIQLAGQCSASLTISHPVISCVITQV